MTSREEICALIAEVYENITGRRCDVVGLVTLKHSAHGWYDVHLWDTGEFYSVRVKKLVEEIRTHESGI